MIRDLNRILPLAWRTRPRMEPGLFLFMGRLRLRRRHAHVVKDAVAVYIGVEADAALC